MEVNGVAVDSTTAKIMYDGGPRGAVWTVLQLGRTNVEFYRTLDGAIVDSGSDSYAFFHRSALALAVESCVLIGLAGHDYIEFRDGEASFGRAIRRVFLGGSVNLDAITMRRLETFAERNGMWVEFVNRTINVDVHVVSYARPIGGIGVFIRRADAVTVCRHDGDPPDYQRHHLLA